MKVFCPTISGICDDGYPGDFQCVLWDEERQLCLLAENMKYTATALQIQAKMQSLLQKPNGKEHIKSLLKDANLE